MSEQQDPFSFHISQIIESKKRQYALKHKDDLPQEEIQKLINSLSGKSIDELALMFVDEQGNYRKLYKETRNTGNQWEGIVSEKFADELRKEFGFSEDYDVQGELSKAIWMYQRRSKKHDSPEKAIKSFREEFEKVKLDPDYESMELIIAITIFEGNNKNRTWRSKVAATRRELLNQNKMSGRAKDWTTKSFFRFLGAIYEDGTGRQPNITKVSSKPRSKPYRFVKKVCDHFGINATTARLKELNYRRGTGG